MGAAPAGAHSLRECGRAMARRRGQVADLGDPVTPTLAHKLMREYDGTDFRPSRNGDGAVPAVAHSLRECGRAMARRRRQFADLGYKSQRCLHASLRGTDAADFRLSRSGDGSCAGWRAQYASVSGSDGATRQAECLPWVSGHTEACMHVGAGSCWDRFSTVEKR